MGIEQRERMVQKSSVAVLKDVSFTSIDKTLFYDVNLSINRGENIVVTGKSGAGKSVLLKIAQNLIEPDTGEITNTKNVRIGYAPQDVEDLNFDEDVTVKELFWKSKGLGIVEDQMETITQDIENASGDRQMKLIQEQSDLIEQYDKMGGYSAFGEMAKILSGLKLDVDSTGHIGPDTKLNEVSSGQKTRILLAQALFCDPDFLVLDDPTSHLDKESVSWLANYLKTTKKASLIATNNIDFTNKCANKIVEITDFGRVLTFDGDYQDYLEKRDRILDAERKQAESLKDQRDKLEDTYKKFKGQGVFKKSSDMAQVGRAIQTRLERMQNEYDQLPGSQQVFSEQKTKDLVFRSETESGNDVLSINGLVKFYGDFIGLDLSKVQFSLSKGEKLLISGENGSGKSTLTRMIASSIGNGKFQPDDGEIKIGSNIKASYYSPDDLGIGREGSPLEEIMKSSTNNNESEAVSILHFWGFSKQMIRSGNIKHLSHGEKKRLSLAKIMVFHPNLLILDEPTDYLEPKIVDRLAKAINGYDGTLILISHSQSFLKKLKLHKELQLPKGNILIKNLVK